MLIKYVHGWNRKGYKNILIFTLYPYQESELLIMNMDYLCYIFYH